MILKYFLFTIVTEEGGDYSCILLLTPAVRIKNEISSLLEFSIFLIFRISTNCKLPEKFIGEGAKTQTASVSGVASESFVSPSLSKKENDVLDIYPNL